MVVEEGWLIGDPKEAMLINQGVLANRWPAGEAVVVQEDGPTVAGSDRRWEGEIVINGLGFNLSNL